MNWFAHTRHMSAAALALVLIGADPARARQECQPKWLPGAAMSGVDDRVNALLRLPNGDLIAGGIFRYAGGIEVNRIARFDGHRWHALGSGFDGEVRGLAVGPNGDIYACGRFNGSGAVPARGVARWNGSEWSALSGGVLNGSVYCIAVLPTGEVVVGGGLLDYSEGRTDIEAWDGQAWHALGTGIGGPSSNDYVKSLCVLPDGSLLAGGYFVLPYMPSSPYIARWNGQQWSSLGNTIGRLGPVNDIELISDGRIAVCTAWDNPGFYGPISVWDGIQWTSVASNVNLGGSSSPNALSLKQAGDGPVYFGGGGMRLRTNSGVVAKTIFSWSGGVVEGCQPDLAEPFLNRISGVNNTISALEIGRNGELFAGGGYSISYRGPIFAKLSERGWTRETEAPDRWVDKVLPMREGGAIVAGAFASIGGTPANLIARFDGTQWQPLGAGLLTPGENEDNPGECADAIELADGSIVAVGTFTVAGGVPANRIARWNGELWMPLGSGLNGYASSVLEIENGKLLVTGDFTTAGGLPAQRIAMWNGTTWQAVGSGLSGFGRCLVQDSDGSVLIGGDFQIAGGITARRLVRLRGNEWSTVGREFDSSVSSLLRRRNGDIVAGGFFTHNGDREMSRIAVWHNGDWTQLGAGLDAEVWSLAEDSQSKLLAGGNFGASGSAPLGGTGLACWNGSVWQGMSGGIGGVCHFSPVFRRDPEVYGIGALANGEIWAGGVFLWAGDPSNDSVNLARFVDSQARIVREPASAVICREGSAEFSVNVGGQDTQLQWQIEDPSGVWLPLREGNMNTHGGGGTFAAAGVFTPRLTLSGFADQASDFPLWSEYQVRCVVKNDCGSAASGVAQIHMCLADFNCDGSIDQFDYLDYVNAFSSGDDGADFDKSGSVDMFDYLEFVDSFHQQC